MARELRAFSVAVPAGTAIATPLSTDCTFPARVVRRIEIDVPPGPRGEVGFYVANSGSQIIPVNAGQWIVANDVHLGWDLTDYIDSGSWQIVAYNTGFYSHTLSARFHVDLPTATDASAPAPLIDPALLSPATLTGG